MLWFTYLYSLSPLAFWYFTVYFISFVYDDDFIDVLLGALLSDRMYDSPSTVNQFKNKPKTAW